MDDIVKLVNITVEYKMKMFTLRAVNNVSFDIKRNAITALVGESGSGKSTLAATILNCLTEPGELVAGDVIFYEKNGEKLCINKMEHEETRKFRWSKVSMVFQGAQSSLNPVLTVFQQFKETLKVHRKKITKQEIIDKCNEVLSIVNLDPSRTLPMYPHELSGGMKQRVMIAFSLLLDPELIILDEPTTALDVITQEYVFSLLKRINQEMHVSMLLLTHDMGIVAKYSDYLGIMYAGTLMEYGTTEEVFEKRYNPYTSQLILATPSLILPIKSIKSIDGKPPNMLELPKGCPFAPRCLKKKDVCNECSADTFVLDDSHLVKCHLYDGGKKYE